MAAEDDLKSFDPEITDAMSAAFHAAWAEVLKSNMPVNGDAESIREGLALHDDRNRM